jgi:alkyldihydroxyacetonephosphate synthase
LPEVVEYQSIVFPGWQQGAQWMREVARLPAALRPASARLMDSKQLQLASAIKEDPTKGALRGLLQNAYLQLRGVAIENAAAVTLVFEGSKDEVWVQKRALTKLLKGTGGLWGGAASGEAGYALTFAIAYLRDFGLDYQILSESLETLAPWSVVHKVWPAVVAAVEAEHSKLRLPGRPFLSCRMTQLYDEGGVLYMYLAICTAGLSSDKALEAFHCLEAAARKAVMKEGGCLSHHHGVGKHRASLLGSTQAPATTGAMQGLKAAVDPENILGARNGAWTDAATHQH